MGGRGPAALAAARAWARGRTYREYGVGLVLVVLLASGAFGGLEDSRDDPPATAPTGRALTVDPFTVTVERVRVGTDLGVDSVPKPVGRYLLVSTRVTVGADSAESVPWTVLRDLVRVEGADGLVDLYFEPGDDVPTDPSAVRPTAIVSGDDAEGLSDIAPGLTYPAVFLFQQVSSAPVPDDVTVVLSSHRRREDTIDREEKWLDPAPAVRVTVPVTAFAPAPEPSS